MLVKDAIKKVVKRLDFELSEVVVTKDAGDECIIAGYANTSTKDRVGDVVIPSAFEKSLETYMKNPVLLANHDWEDPVGVTIEARIDEEKGLWIKARISDTRSDVKTLVREKCLRTFSIGYNEIDADYDESTKTKYVKDLELLEISIVTVPANAEAMFDVFDQKAEDTPEKSYFVAGMKEFVGEIEKTLTRKMEGPEVGALCSYFIDNKGDKMKTKELIELLSKKSAPAPVADAAKADGAKPGDAKPEADAGKPDPMKAMQDQLNALAQGMAKVLEMMDKLSAAEAGEDKPADEAKPEDKPKDEPKAADESEDEKADDAKPEQKPEDEMSEEDCEKAIAELTAEIEALEDQI